MSLNTAAAVAWGRMNPPTVGHLQLLKTLNSIRGADKFVYLSHTQDPLKNPLSYDKKIYFVRQLFAKKFPAIDFVDSDARTIVEVLQELQQYRSIIVLAGGDRVPEYQKLLDSYNGRQDKQGRIPFSFDEITVVNAGDRDPDAEGVSGMSASKLRAVAKAGDFTAFSKGIPTHDKKLSKQLFDAVRQGMKLTERQIREANGEDGVAVVDNPSPSLSELKQSFDMLMKRYSPEEQKAFNFNEAIKYTDLETAYKKLYDSSKDKNNIPAPEVFTADWTMNKVRQATQKFFDVRKQNWEKLVAEEIQAAQRYAFPQLVGKVEFADILLTTADPPTRYHESIIAQFVKKNAASKIPVIIYVVPDTNKAVDASVAAMWVHKYIVKPTYGDSGSGTVIVLSGALAAVIDNLADLVVIPTFYADPRKVGSWSQSISTLWDGAILQSSIGAKTQVSELVDKLGNPVQVDRSSKISRKDFILKGSQYKVGSKLITQINGVIDSPNSAKKALEVIDQKFAPMVKEVGKNNLKLLQDLAKNGLKSSVKAGKSQTKLLLEWDSARLNAFKTELPTKTGNDFTKVYSVFIASHEKKTGKSMGGFFKEVFAKELEILKQAADLFGLGAAIGVVKALKKRGVFDKKKASQTNNATANVGAETSSPEEV